MCLLEKQLVQTKISRNSLKEFLSSYQKKQTAFTP